MHMFKWNISLKIFVSTSLLTFICIALISMSAYSQYSDSLKEQSSEKVQQITDLTSLNIETYLEDLYRLSLSPYYDQDVMDALDKNIDDSDLKTLYRTRTIEDFLEQILIIPRSDILRVFIFTDEIYKGERIPTTIDLHQNYYELDWYQKVLEIKEPLFVSAHLEQIIKNPKNIIFSIVGILRSTRNTDKILGVIKVDANYSSISDICNQADLGPGGGIFIMDENKQLIFSNIHSLSTIDFETIYHQILQNGLASQSLKLSEESYLINSALIQKANWTIVGVTSLNTINKKITAVRQRSFMIAWICFLMALLLIVFFLHMFLNPLKKIIINIHKIQDGHLDVLFKAKSNDEINYLARSLNDMVSELKKMFHENDLLVHQIYEAKYLQKEAQINSLFSQIQPHFIHNTLNMISMLVQTNELESAVTHINKLSIMLRGLTHLDKDIPVSTELELLDAYLAIQKNRYLNRMDYAIEVDTKLYSYIIPALLLQPIVENSVVHGCESKKGKTFIKISSRIEAENIVFIIEDDGIGMSPELLLKTQEKLSSNQEDTAEVNITSKSSGIALVNVNKRIQIKYGSSYGLRIQSGESQGTIVSIYLPIN